MKRYVLDANEVIALLQNEKGAGVVENMLLLAMDRQCQVFMHRLNLLEVYYGYLRADGETIANKHINAIEKSCIIVDESFSKALMLEAGKIKVKYRMSLADAIAVACAITKQAIFITSDHHELDAADKDNAVEILWFR